MNGDLITQEGQYEFTNPQGDSVLLGRGTPYRVLESTGLLDVPERVGTSEIYGDRHGGSYNGLGYIGIRRPILSVAAQAEADGTAAHALLEELMRIVSQGNADGTLAVRREGKDTRLLFCHPMRTDFPGGWELHKGLARGSVEFEAVDPMWYSVDELEHGSGMADPGGGRLYARTYPMTYGLSLGSGDLVVTNYGNMDSYPILLIRGPVVSPVIQNASQDMYVQFDTDVAAGQVLRVDMAAHTAVIDNFANRRGSLHPLSQWWSLSPGDNQIRFLGQTYSPDALLSVVMRSAWSTA